MTKEQVKNGIYDYICDADSSRFARLCKDYHDTTGEGCDFEEMCDFDDNMEGSYSPTDIANMVTCGSWDDSDSYYQCDGSSIETFDDLSDYFDLEWMADYCVENDDDLGDCRIKDLLDKLNDGDFTITLHYPTGDTEQFTMDTLRDSTLDMDELYHGKDGCLMKLSEWLDEIEEANDNEDCDLYKLDFEQLLCEKCATELTVVGYEGRVFGKGYFDGRPFRWFYNVEHDILLKLVYDADKTDVLDNSYRYIVECADHSVNGVFQLVRAL